MLKFFRLNYNEGIALFSPCPRKDLSIVNELLGILYTEFINSYSGEVKLNSICRDLINKVLAKLVRRDCDDLLLSDSIDDLTLVQKFIFRTDESGECEPPEIMDFLEYEPRKSSKYIPPVDQEITEDNVPIPSSGVPDYDLFAYLLCVCDGRFGEALRAWETLDADQLDGILFYYSQLRKDPKERMKEYMAEKMNERIESFNEKQKSVLIFGSRVSKGDDGNKPTPENTKLVL